jgi:hypothetical protein
MLLIKVSDTKTITNNDWERVNDDLGGIKTDLK